MLAWGLLLLASCAESPKKEPKVKTKLGCDHEAATAVFLVDKKRGSDEEVTWVRVAKVRANVYSDGTFRIISYCLPQEREVKEYLRKRVAAYTIRRELMEEGYIKPGQQYLILRYQPHKVNK